MEKDRVSRMEKNKKGLRRGWTTGTCAQAAAAAAAEALLAGGLPREREGWTVTVHLPEGQPFTLPVQSGREEKRDGEGRLTAVTCAVKKDSGDDPDVTDGVTVCATVSLLPEDRIEIEGGEGVGRVTKAGLA